MRRPALPGRRGRGGSGGRRAPSPADRSIPPSAPAAGAEEESHLQLRVHPAGLAGLAGLVLAARLPALAPGGGPGFALLSALAAALVVDAVWSVVALRRRGLVVTAVAPADATVGEPTTVRLSVGGRAAPLLVRISSVRGAPWLRLDAPDAGDIETHPERRGEFRSIEVSLLHSAPLGLVGAVRTVPVALATPILVGPKPLTGDDPIPPPAQREWEPELDWPAVPSLDGDLVRGARPYQPGDTPRRVHWPLTARTGQIMVRELDAAQRPQVVVRVDLGSRPGPSAETVAGRAAGVITRIRAAGYPVVLITQEAGGRRVGPADRPLDVGRRLALAVPGPPTGVADQSAGRRSGPGRSRGIAGPLGTGGPELVVDPDGWRWQAAP